MNTIKSTGAIAPVVDQAFPQSNIPTGWPKPKYWFGQLVRFIDTDGHRPIIGLATVRGVEYFPEELPPTIKRHWGHIYPVGYYYSLIPLENQGLGRIDMANTFDLCFSEEDLEAIE